MAISNININFSQIEGLTGRVETNLGDDVSDQYQKMIGIISSSKGKHAESLKKELAKEEKMIKEVHKLMKQIAKLIEEASDSLQAVDNKYSKSHLS